MAIDIGSVTINKNPAFGTNWATEVINQHTRMTATADRVTYDSSSKIIRGTILLKNVAKSEGDSLRTYLEDTAEYGLNSFTIDPPAGVDLGAGDGTALTLCFYDGGPTLEGVFDLIPPGFYNITLPYWKKG